MSNRTRDAILAILVIGCVALSLSPRRTKSTPCSDTPAIRAALHVASYGPPPKLTAWRSCGTNSVYIHAGHLGLAPGMYDFRKP